MSVATESKGINIPPGTTNRTNRKFKKKFTREIGDVSNIFFLSFFPFDSIYVQNHSTLRSSSTLESQLSSLPLFERTKSNLLPFVYVSFSFARPLIHSAFYRTLFARGSNGSTISVIKRNTFDSVVVVVVVARPMGHHLPIRANIFEKCIDVITKQVFTSFHSRFIRYS